MMLAATEAGFGGCMIGSFDKDAAKELLGLSEDLIPMLLLALGKPDEEVVLTDAEKDIAYYRANGKHYTPKRTRNDLIV
jgi:nitroreductase